MTSRRLFGPASLTTSAATVYTAPTATVISRGRVSNPSGGVLTFTMSIGADAVGTRLYAGTVIPAGGSLDIRGPFSLNQGDIVQAFGSGTALVLELNGVENSDFAYSTVFSVNESPLSVGGDFSQDGGTDWTYVVSTDGVAYGTQTEPPSKPPYDDSYTILRAGGAWPMNYRVEATIHKTGLSPASQPEVWLGLRWSDSPGFSIGYEANLHVNGNYATIGRWPGPIGTNIDQYTVLDFQFGVMSPQDGDILRFEIIGYTMTSYLVRDGVATQLCTGTDSTPGKLSTGNPCFGFYTDGGDATSDFGFTTFSAVSI